MAVMKYKENGEWVAMPAAVVNTVETIGGFRYAFIPKATNNSYDLSSYVAPGADFMLWLYAEDGYDNASPLYIWINSYGKIRVPRNIEYISHTSNSFGGCWLDEVTTANNYSGKNIIEVNYDDTTRIFSLTGTNERVSPYAVLFY